MSKAETIKIGEEVGLTNVTLHNFTEYVIRRDFVGDSYLTEWAKRFRDGIEWDKSDTEGRMILRQIAPGYYPKTISQ